MALTALRRKAPEYGDMMNHVDPGHHPGMCISFNDDVLKQLDLDDDVEVGDMLHMRVMVEVTSVHKDASGCRIEAAITHGEVEDEDKE